jgi:hypothetical protein
MEVWQEPWTTWILHDPAWVPADNITRCKALDIVVKRLAGPHILKRLVANRFVKAERDGDHFG